MEKPKPGVNELRSARIGRCDINTTTTNSAIAPAHSIVSMTRNRASRTIHRQLAKQQGIAVERKEPAYTIPIDTTHTVHAI